jgi:hypothetical protein
MHPLEGTIPFNFKVGDRSFTSGEYNISLQSSNGLLKVAGKDGHQAIYVLSQPGKKTLQTDMNAGKLVFNKYGEQYFLSKVVNPWEALELGIPKSKAEKELAKNQTANFSGHNQTVLIALKTH